MTSTSDLKQLVLQQKFPSDRRDATLRMITADAQLNSVCLREPNFRRIHPNDLRLLFELYDESMFEGRLQRSLRPSTISFRLSKRMTRAGGKTTRFLNRAPGAIPRYEIAVSTTLLFESFRDPKRGITVTGLECTSRLDALMRVMEHELIHLTEMIVWEKSSCSQSRFQGIAARMFGHTDHRHDLITPRETALKEFGVRPGVRVRFRHDGHTYEGIVNRVTKRATVLVPDPQGQRFSDGEHYARFYVPVPLLEPLAD